MPTPAPSLSGLVVQGPLCPFSSAAEGQPAVWMVVSTPKPFTNSHLSPRYSTLPGRRALKNSRLVSQKDDVHVCILCLRAIMNYQVRGSTSHGARALLPNQESQKSTSFKRQVCWWACSQGVKEQPSPPSRSPLLLSFPLATVRIQPSHVPPPRCQ